MEKTPWTTQSSNNSLVDKVMYLIFDTETTGFFKKELPYDHPDQGRIVQLGALLLDKEFKEVSCFYTLIQPDGWNISPGAQAVHGITIEQCKKYGMPIGDAMRILSSMYDKSVHVVAHNLNFDSTMIDVEHALLGAISFNWEEDGLCTMLNTTDLCCIPKPSGRSGNKWPKLVEALDVLLKQKLDKAHDAMADCKGCADLFKWLVQNGKLKLNT
jgi:DNA polymerase III epsilon subunit-like protein